MPYRPLARTTQQSTLQLARNAAPDRDMDHQHKSELNAPKPQASAKKPDPAQAKAKPPVGAGAGAASNYAAQRAGAAPKPQGATAAQGATLVNNQPLREQGKPGAQKHVPAHQREPGQYHCLGQTLPTLQAVHDWLAATQPKDSEVVIQCTAASGIREQTQTTWHYYNPAQKIVLDGSGAAVTGFDGPRPTQGYYLSYRPAVGQGTTAERPAAANLEVKNLSIAGFEAGGIEISPQTVAGAQDKWAGGLSAFVGGAAVRDCDFRDLGTKGTPAQQRVWNDLRFGAGGIMMRGVQNSTFERNQFKNLTNGETTFRGTDEHGKPTERQADANHLFHAIYARDGSSGNTIAGNEFNRVGGDAVRVSNGSNRNIVDGNTARDSGVHGLVSNWFNTAKHKPDRDSTGTVISNNKIGKTFGGKSQGTAYNRHESKGKPGKVTA